MSYPKPTFHSASSNHGALRHIAIHAFVGLGLVAISNLGENNPSKATHVCATCSLGRPLQRHNLSPLLLLIQVIRPSLHHSAALGQVGRSVISPSIRILHCMRELMFDDVRPEPQHLVQVYGLRLFVRGLPSG